MAILQNFKDFDHKKKFFSSNQYYIIDTQKEFDSWFDLYNQENKSDDRVNYIYRGMTEAKYRLYTSAQRQWITNDMNEWVPNGFLDYIRSLLVKAKQDKLLQRVFDIYNYDTEQREIPLLSILQHYGAPTPLMDWTYNINVALFFATQEIRTGVGLGSIENYFSIYFVNKVKQKKVFKNIFQAQHKKQPSLEGIEQYIQEKDDKTMFYISDFEVGTYNKRYTKFTINSRQPLTSIFNQNIIPQEGLFIFNPSPTQPIDEVFTLGKNGGSNDFFSQPFACFNIKKDLADYVRRRIKNRVSIDSDFIYPNLKVDAKYIHENTLYGLAS